MKRSEMTPEELEALHRENVSFAIFSVLVFALCLLFIRFIATKTVVHGTSMADTLQDNDILIMERVTYYFTDPDRFDIVILNTEKASEKRLIKRVIGLPGETVEIKSGSVYINGTLLSSDVYAKSGYTSSMSPVTLGEDEYFVMGDNRDDSLDSRGIGPIPREDIIGRAMLRIRPIRHIKLFRRGGER